MAAFEPFEPAVKSGAQGQTIQISAVTTAGGALGQINSTGGMNPTVLVTAQAPVGANQQVFIRMSVESSTTIAATTTDTPMIATNTGTVRLFANPSPAGITNIAVICTVTGSPVLVWFTPGQGGDV